jgi:hypothetical protein
MTNRPDLVNHVEQALQQHPYLVGFIVLVVLVALWVAADPDPDRCRAKRAGYRCVHEDGHPGSHRDEFGDYWN